MNILRKIMDSNLSLEDKGWILDMVESHAVAREQHELADEALHLRVMLLDQQEEHDHLVMIEDGFGGYDYLDMRELYKQPRELTEEELSQIPF